MTLAQEHVINLAVQHFVQLGWAARLHCLQEERGAEKEDSFALPVFVLVCTKFRQPMPSPILEMCIGDDGAPIRYAQVSELLSSVRECQAYSVLRKRLRTSIDPDSDLSLTLCHAKTGLPRYTLTVQDNPPGAKVLRPNQFAIFIGESFSFVSRISCVLAFVGDYLLSLFSLLVLSVPRGSETAWLYSSSEGRRQLAASANFRRLVIALMHRNQEYADMQAVQSELSPVVMDLAPPDMPTNQQVNIHIIII